MVRVGRDLKDGILRKNWRKQCFKCTEHQKEVIGVDNNKLYSASML